MDFCFSNNRKYNKSMSKEAVPFVDPSTLLSPIKYNKTPAFTQGFAPFRMTDRGGLRVVQDDGRGLVSLTDMWSVRTAFLELPSLAERLHFFISPLAGDFISLGGG